MKVIENVTIYRCEFCGKIYLRKRWCEKHESNCKVNPINFQKCLSGCIFLEQKKIKYLYGNPYETGEQTTDGLFCSKKNIYVYPYWCQDPIIQDDIIDEIPNEPMPDSCDLFSDLY